MQAGRRQAASTVTACRPDRRALLAPVQIGTGVMVGLPGQTLRDLAGDILFFRDLGADMIGMVGSLAGEP